MRVTQQSMTRNYLKNLNRNLERLSDSSSKISSQRKFDKVSQDPVAAAKSFKVRTQLEKNEQFLRNINDIKDELSTAENSVMQVVDLLKTVKERIIQAKNGTLPQTSMDVIAREIANIKDEILTNANVKFGDKYLFAGSNSSEAPFSVDVSGNLLYNGVNINDIVFDPTTSKPSISNGLVPPTLIPVPLNKDVYVDMGLGIKVSDNNVDPKTALKISFSGLDILGFGESNVNGTNMSNNVYNFLNQVETAIKNGDSAAMTNSLNHIDNIIDNTLLNVTDIGSKTNFLDSAIERIDSENFNLKNTQSNLESLNIEQEVIYNKSFEAAWMVTLQLGNKILPSSIFDFMR